LTATRLQERKGEKGKKKEREGKGEKGKHGAIFASGSISSVLPFSASRSNPERRGGRKNKRKGREVMTLLTFHPFPPSTSQSARRGGRKKEKTAILLVLAPPSWRGGIS